jgi:hypothetical protein
MVLYHACDVTKCVTDGNTQICSCVSVASQEFILFILIIFGCLALFIIGLCLYGVFWGK